MVTDSPPLDNGAVGIWCRTLRSADASPTQFWNVLSMAERQAAEKFHRPEDRARSIIARATLRQICGLLLDVPADSFQIAADSDGKPHLTGAMHGALEVNVSHSGSVVLVAASRDRAVGIDVEQLSGAVDIERIAERMFAPAERDSLAVAPLPTRPQLATQIWVRKEAYLKATGSGLRRPLSSFAVTGPSGWTSAVDGWAVGSVKVPDGYVGAVSAFGSGALPVNAVLLDLPLDDRIVS